MTTEDPDPSGSTVASAPRPWTAWARAWWCPAGQTTRITLVSKDVIHGFYVPEFNFSRYAQPGVTNVFDLTVEHVGHLPGPVHPVVRAVPLAHVLPRGGAAPRPVPGVAELAAEPWPRAAVATIASSNSTTKAAA